MRKIEKNPYSDGSGLLTSGAISPLRMRLVFLSLYFATCVAGIFLTVTRGWPVPTCEAALAVLPLGLTMFGMITEALSRLAGF